MKTENTHTMKHTPTPWEVTGELDYIRISNRDSQNPDSCDGIRQVAHVVQGDYEIPNYEEAMANAQHIIHCVNTHAELLEALKRAAKLVSLLTVRQVINGGDKAIDAAGLNPWCMNEGLATGDEPLSVDFIDAAIAKATKEGK